MTNIFYILSRKLYIFLFRISEMDKRCNMISSDKDIFFFLSFDMFSSRESRESRENIHRYRLYVPFGAQTFGGTPTSEGETTR